MCFFNVCMAGDGSMKIDNRKTAIVYFSCTGNTKAVAETIAKLEKIQVFEIIPKENYTDSDLNYRDGNCRANVEQRDEEIRPAIKNNMSSTCGYDAIYLGYSIWWRTAQELYRPILKSIIKIVPKYIFLYFRWQ